MSRHLLLASLLISSFGVFTVQSHARDETRGGNATPSSSAQAKPMQLAAKKKDVSTRPTSPDASDTPPGKATFNGEVLFGSQTVSFLVDRDIIRVGPEIGKFDRLRFRVLGNDIFVSSLDVIYEGGEKETLLTNKRVNRNRKTSWMPLKTGSFIKEIRLVYNSRPNARGNARVEVFGEYTDGWLGADGEARKHNGGWVLLGTDTAGMIGYDKVTIRVGENDGGFKKLRVSVKDRDITLTNLTVVYEDDTKENLASKRQRVRANSEFGPLELEKDQAIKEIRGGWRSRAVSTSRRNRPYATVQVWGQH